jgi:phosphomannomutase
MLQAVGEGYRTVVGYEANGGFLTASDINSSDTSELLLALPTRDAVLPITAALRRSILEQKSLSQQVSDLPATFTSSGLIKEFPNELGHSIVDSLEVEGSRLVSRFFGETFGSLESLDFTDGARMIFSTGDVVHLRPSGNAPEFRCYTEASTQGTADENNRKALEIVKKVIRPHLELKEQ